MLEFLTPVEHFGRKFDRGSILFEFDALREPERTNFPIIGAYLRARGCEFREVAPSMLWRGKLWPDLYIANQLDAIGDEFSCSQHTYAQIPDKAAWPATFSLFSASLTNHGKEFHESFIEPMCRKITGRSSSEIAAKYHRAIWCPIYWPQTLRARQSIPTPFFYPCGGYAGAVREGMALGSNVADGRKPRDFHGEQPVESVDLEVAFVVAQPRAGFSVCFVVDDSPIYRVTDMDACAGIEAEFHRFVVEYRGECNVAQELTRLGLTYHPRHMAFGSARLQLPTLANVARGWTPRPHINDQLWSIINEKS